MCANMVAFFLQRLTIVPRVRTTTGKSTISVFLSCLHSTNENLFSFVVFFVIANSSVLGNHTGCSNCVRSQKRWKQVVENGKEQKQLIVAWWMIMVDDLLVINLAKLFKLPVSVNDIYAAVLLNFTISPGRKSVCG